MHPAASTIAYSQLKTTSLKQKRERDNIDINSLQNHGKLKDQIVQSCQLPLHTIIPNVKPHQAIALLN